MSMAPSWERRFSERQSPIVLAIIGFFFVMLGSIFVLIDSPNLLAGRLPTYGGFGALFVVLGIAITVCLLYFGKSKQIVCRPDGFTVSVSSRSQGTSENRFAWSEVTATSYHEESFRDGGGKTRIVGYFTVETTKGQAFSVSRGTQYFPDLIALFNHQTTQLPYVWKLRLGINHVNLQDLGFASGLYEQVARDATATPAANAVAGEPAMAGLVPTADPLPPYAQSSGTNLFGLFGLILSVFSLPACGLLAPIGLILSLIGLTRPNKGLAIAGTLVSLAGSALFFTVGLAVVWSVWAGGDSIKTSMLLGRSATKIREHRREHGTLPDEAAAKQMLLAEPDSYGNPLRYKVLVGEQERFELRSAGPDKTFDTPDDNFATYDAVPPGWEGPPPPTANPDEPPAVQP